MTRPAIGFRLRDFPAEVKFTLGVYLLLAGVGMAADFAASLYGDRRSGSDLFDTSHIRAEFSGLAERPVSHVERVLEAVDGPFNGTGSMRPAFTTRSDGWDSQVRVLTPMEAAQLAAEREGERLALLAWVRAGGDRLAYDRDEYDAGAGLAGQPITSDLSPGPGRVRIRSLIERRCVTCHSEGGRMDRARLKPFDTYDRLRPVVSAPADPQLTRSELARGTATRLTVYGLVFASSGVLLGFTAMTRGLRRLLGPLPILALGLATACAWLARWDTTFVWGFIAGGFAAAAGFAAHVAVVSRELARVGCEPTAGDVECECPPSTGR